MDKDVYAAGVRLLRTASTLLPCLFVNTAASAPNVLSRTDHGAPFIAPAIQAVIGTGVVDDSVYVDYDLQDPILDLDQPSTSTFSAASGAQVNHAPYAVVSYSVCCSAGAGDDNRYYQTLNDSNAILSNAAAFAVGGPLPAGTAPPISTTTTSSPNSGNGGTGWGIEFGLTASYLGLNTTADSWNTAAMAGFLAALKHQHPAWTWFDIKAALRQTASNWPTGYSHLRYGYGFIDWFAANAISSPGLLYLQPPGVQINLDETTVTIQLYPFRQTRRIREVAYSVDPAYTWPAGKNELTAADIAAAGGKLLFTSNGTDLIATFSIPEPTGAPLGVIAFSTDDAGHFSRVEEFSLHQIANQKVADAPVPRWAHAALTGMLLFLMCALDPRRQLTTRRSPGTGSPRVSAPCYKHGRRRWSR